VGSLIGLAQTQVALREFKPALDTAGTLLELDKGNVAARLVRSAAKMGLGQPGEARTELNSILHDYPDTPDAMVQLGLLARHDKNLKEAETWFQKAYSANPTNLRTLLALVDTILVANQPDRAIELVRAETQKRPGRSELHELLGNILLRTGKPDAAIAEYKGAADAIVAKDKPAAIRLYVKAGEVYRIKGDHGNAIKLGESAQSMNDRNFQTLAFLALAYDGAGRREDAKRVYEEAIKLDPTNVVMLNNYAYLLADTGGNLDQALGYAQRAMQSKPDIDEISDTLGWIYMKKQLTDNAIEMFQKVVNKQPKNPMYRYHLAMALDQKGDRTEAKKHVQIALQNNPPTQEIENMKRLLAK
jgi:tetratricopeptide (TPR) repeat protein